MSLSEYSGRDDEYWKCKRNTNILTAKEIKAILKDRGYAVGESTGKTRLISHLKRSDRGLISYNPYSNDELRRLVHARRIWLDFDEEYRVGTREELLRALERADDEPTFNRFSDLPAELRTRVYKYHFSDFSSIWLYAPIQPPITRASSLLRKEALPLFHQQCIFVIEMSVPRSATTAIGNSRICLKSLAWLGGITKSSISDIRRLVFRLYGASYVTVEVLISTKSSVRVVDDSLGLGMRPRAESNGLKKVQEIVKNILTREEMSKLRKSDLFELRSAAEHVYE